MTCVIYKRLQELIVLEKRWRAPRVHTRLNPICPVGARPQPIKEGDLSFHSEMQLSPGSHPLRSLSNFCNVVCLIHRRRGFMEVERS